MSDNDDLLADDHDDLGDQSLADYNLGNEEEEQLLADDYDTGSSQNVPPSVGYGDQSGIASSDYTVLGMEYGVPQQPEPYTASDTECVVPNITVEVPNVPHVQPMREPPTYAPYEPPPYEVEVAVVPPAIPASPIESPQIVPSEILTASPNDSLDGGAPRERFTSERPAGSQRLPQIRDIPDSLDKVYVPRGGFGPRNRTTWRNPQLQARYGHPYRRNNQPRGNFQTRPSFPAPRASPPHLDHRPRLEPPQIAPDLPPMPPQGPPFVPDQGPMRGPFRPDDGPNRGPFGPNEGPNRGPFRPDEEPNIGSFGPNEGPNRGPFRPDEGPNVGPFGPNDGPNRGPFRSEEGSNRGMFRPDEGPNRGPFGPNNGPNRGPLRPEEGSNRGPFRPDEGPIRGPFGPNDGPNRNHFRPDEGPNRGPFGPNDGPNRGPFGPNDGPNRGPFGPNDGPNRGPFGPNDGPNRGPFGPNDGPNRGPFGPDGPNRGPFGPNPFRPDDGPNRGPFRPNEEPRGPFRPDDGPNMPFRPEERPFPPSDGQMRPMFAPMLRFNGQPFAPRQQFQYRPQFARFAAAGPRDAGPNGHQMVIRQPLPAPAMDGREPEVRMLPVQLPGHLPPGGLAGKKVLINPHFKGNFQPPPVEGLTYIPTRIVKSPPLGPTLGSQFGPANLEDAAERFIAEQRSALARAAGRKAPPRRSPQRFIENTTIEIENELARGPPGPGLAPGHGPGLAPGHGPGLAPGPPGPGPAPQPAPPGVRTPEDDLLRRQEEFINANRAGLRRRMRSPSPPRRSPPSPRRSASPRRERRASPPRFGPLDEESEYRRRVREQESIRERVLRAKEVRRRKNAVALHRLLQDRQREQKEKDKEPAKPPAQAPPALERDRKPDSTTKILDRERSPQREGPEVNSTENLTPPREAKVDEKQPAAAPRASPERALTPPLPLAPGPGPGPGPAPAPAPGPGPADSEDDLDLILGDIDGILSEDEEDTGRFKERVKAEAARAQPADLRAKLPPRPAAARPPAARRPPKQRIVFGDDRPDRKPRAEKSPPPIKRSLVTSSTNTEVRGGVDKADRKHAKAKRETENASAKARPRITFDAKEKEAEKPAPKVDDLKRAQPFNRRVVLQRKPVAKTPDKADRNDKSVFTRVEIQNDPTQPTAGIFSRAVRTAIGGAGDKNRIVVKKLEEPEVEFDSDGSEEDRLLSEEGGCVAMVTNLPHGMTDTRLKTLAGSDVQSVNLDKEERSARVVFKTSPAADAFRRKFNNKMVAASRLTVTLV